MILIPTSLIFLASEYISLNIYGDTITIEADGSLPSISPFPILFIQILGIASLFCIMFFFKSNDYLKKSPVYGHFRKTAA